jgi:MFS family permease
MLAFAILSSIGNSCLFSPAMGAISHWFNERRGEASGFAFTGSGFGGVHFPLMFQSLVPQVGWHGRCA